VRTDPIHLEGRTAPFTLAVNAVPDRPGTRVLDPREISVQIEVDVVPVKATFDAVPVVFASQEYEASAQPPSVRVVISGPPEVVRAIRADQIRAVAEVSGLAPSREPYTVRLRVEFAGVKASDLARLAVTSISHPKIAVRVSGRRIVT